MDESRDPATVTAWLSDIREWSPDLFAADGAPSPVALQIAQSCVDLKDAGAGDNWKAILTTAAAIAANAFTLERSHGSVNPTRARVDSLLREYDRDPSPVARRVDPMEGARHQYTKGRNKKGATTYRQNMSGEVVMSYGVAPVQGATDAPNPDNVRAAMASHLLGYVRSLALGLNSLNVCQVTNAIYGDVLDPCVIGMHDDGSDRHAPMIGTDYETKQQVFDPAAYPYPIAEHNAIAPWQGARSGVVCGHVEETANDPRPDIGPRRPVVIWQAHANGAHHDETRRANTRRTRLARVSARKSEALKLETFRTLCVMRTDDGRTIDLSTTRRPLLAPADHNGRPGYGDIGDDVIECAWFGHKLMLRGARARKNPARETTRALRRAHVSRSLPAVDITTQASAEVLLADMTPGQSVRLRVNGTFILTVSRRVGKFNLSLNAGAPVGQTGRAVWHGGLQIRSVSTAARRIAHAVNS